MTVRGKFITVEGLEGAGKSTSIELIAELVADSGRQVITTREPGGTALGEQLRKLLLDPEQKGVDPVAEMMLMFAARRQHVAELIEPALAAGTWVVCDRFTDSTYAYQGGGRELGADLVSEFERLAIDGFEPDLTIVLDMDVDGGLQRAAEVGEADRFEQETREFFLRVRKVFLARAESSPRCRVVAADQPLPQVREEVTGFIKELLANA